MDNKSDDRHHPRRGNRGRECFRVRVRMAVRKPRRWENAGEV